MSQGGNYGHVGTSSDYGDYGSDFGAHGMDRGDPNLPAYADPVPYQPLYGTYSSFRPQGAAVGAGGIGLPGLNIHGPFQPSAYSTGRDAGESGRGGVAWAGWGDVAEKAERERSRDAVDPKDPRYLYRQFANGDLLFLRSPNATEVNRRFSQASNNTLWNAITARIGDYAAWKRASTQQAITQVAQGVSATSSAVAASLLAGRRHRGGRPLPPPVLAPVLAPAAPDAEIGSYLPWIVAGVGTLVVVAIVLAPKRQAA